MSLSPENPAPPEENISIADVSWKIQLPGIQEEITVDPYSWAGGAFGIAVLHLLSEALQLDSTLAAAVAKYTVGGYFGSRVLGPYFRALAISAVDWVQGVGENINLE